MSNFMMLSNIFLFLPVVASAYVHEWIYFIFASGISIFSTVYHYLKENHSKNKKLVSIVKKLDWVFAVGSYIYMYYFIFAEVTYSLHLILAILLSMTAIFFWYGWKVGNYHKIHPWFHVFEGTISALIVLSK